MRRCYPLLPILFSLLLTTSFTPPAVADDQNSIVIVFKNGHQQTFSLADIAHIEFKTVPSPSSAAKAKPSAGQGKFLGKWKVGDGQGGTFIITLEENGVASKTKGADGGTWVVVDNEARISWGDGWHDAIRKVGSKYQKVAFSPDKTFTDEPSNVTDATPAESKPI